MKPSKTSSNPQLEAPTQEKNPAAVALGRLGGLAPKRKAFGLAAVSKKKRKEVSRLGVEARRRKRASSGTEAA